MTTTGTTQSARPAGRRGKPKPWLAEVLALHPAGIQWGRAVMFLDVALVPLVVLLAIGEARYLFSAVFGVLFAGVADPGGPLGRRSLDIGAFGLAGAAVTAIGFEIATTAWGWVVLVAFALTLAAGLALRFGMHRFVAGLLLNIWFFVALDLGWNQRSSRVTTHTWAQVVAWTAGVALWLAFTFLVWLVRGRRDLPTTLPELPGDTAPRPLTPPVVAFALLRALGMAGATAIAFGAGLAHADWLPIAAIVAMKPDLHQTTVVAVQRVAGAVVGAIVAALLLLVVASQHGTQLISITSVFEVVVLIIFMHGAAIRFWNYACYTAAIASGALLMGGLSNPSDYSAEGERVLWTIAGVAIAVLVMLVGGLLGKVAAARAAPKPLSSS